MKIPSAKEKDFVLNLYYNRDVKGIAPPREEDCPHNFREIEAILNDDGYIVSNNGYLVISTKGRAFLGKGGYTAVRNKEWLIVSTSAHWHIFFLVLHLYYILPSILSEQV